MDDRWCTEIELLAILQIILNVVFAIVCFKLGQAV